MKNLFLMLLALTVCCSVGGLTGDLYAQTKSEICDNGQDDDGDKLVDCDDPDCKCTTTEICDNGRDDDGDKLVDCDDPDCKCPPPGGKPCSPGYWKNHLSAFNQYCAAAAAIPNDPFDDCGDLWTALNCHGSDASCKRSAAAAALNAVSGCTED